MRGSHPFEAEKSRLAQMHGKSIFCVNECIRTILQDKGSIFRKTAEEKIKQEYDVFSKEQKIGSDFNKAT